ncbi:kinase-like domain-containing protein [Rhizoctonia solani]|nr:kinase-like domain-containing protein [Rhizoctonia solani]
MLASPAMMQNPRVGLSLRIDTDVERSLHPPRSVSNTSTQDTLWQTPITPGATRGPRSFRVDWAPGIFVSWTIKVQVSTRKGYPAWQNDGNCNRMQPRGLVGRRGCIRSASATSAGANSVLKTVIRKLMVDDAFQQLSAARLWAMLMKRPSSVLFERVTRPDFLADLERAICSSCIEMVAADRMIAVLTTVIHDFQHQKGTERLKQLWDKLCAQKVLDDAPIHPDDPLYSPGSLVGSNRGASMEGSTVPTPYYAAQTQSNLRPSEIRPAEQTGTISHDSTKMVYSAMNGRPPTKHQTRVLPEVVIEEDEEIELPPPYSPSQVASTSTSRMPSVVDTYPFAKGYAHDVGPDIDLDSLEPHPFARGAFGDVRRASLRNGMPVAIKCLRFYTQAQDTGRHKLERKSLKEIRVWSFLNHENVLPLLGLCVVNNELGMVSELMPNGNIQDYIRNNPDVNRYQLAIRICAGLVYLHEHPKHVVHGDLKALNVVVDANGIPKLTDFGLAQMIRAEDSTERSSSSCAGGTSRWMAPELIGSDSPNAPCEKPSFASDVHALAMTIYEIFSGTLPFFGLKREPQVILAIMNREQPERIPEVFTDELWDLLCRCWKYNAQERPTARQVLHVLQELDRS